MRFHSISEMMPWGLFEMIASISFICRMMLSSRTAAPAARLPIAMTFRSFESFTITSHAGLYAHELSPQFIVFPLSKIEYFIFLPLLTSSQQDFDKLFPHMSSFWWWPILAALMHLRCSWWSFRIFYSISDYWYNIIYFFSGASNVKWLLSW